MAALFVATTASTTSRGSSVGVIRRVALEKTMSIAPSSAASRDGCRVADVEDEWLDGRATLGCGCQVRGDGGHPGGIPSGQQHAIGGRQAGGQCGGQRPAEVLRGTGDEGESGRGHARTV